MIMDAKEKQLREQIGLNREEMKAIRNKAETEKRALSEDERTKITELFNAATDAFNEAEMLRMERETELKAQGKGFSALPEQKQPKSEKESRFELLMHTGKILSAAANKGMDMATKKAVIEESQKALTELGHYKMAADGFNTLIDTDGGVFLPTTVSDMAYDIAREYGVFARLGMRFPTGGGRIKIPNVMGDLEFQAVNETADILVDTFTFKGLELDDLKWALFIPWSNEVEGVRGAQLVEIILRKLGEALGRKIDDVVINADGTSDYHNIKGLIDRGNDASATWVRNSVAIATHDSYDELTYLDWSNGQLDVAPSLGSRGVYITHPNFRVKLMQQALAPSASNDAKWVTMVGEQIFVFGRPVYFTEAFPYSDGASKPYAIYCDPSYVAVADQGSFTTELFSEATISTTSGGTIKLASQDMKALRVKAFFDVEFSPVTVDDNGTTKGAFAVLTTAAS